MKAVVQRVKEASVTIDGRRHSSIGHGMLILLGIHKSDTSADIEWMARKIAQARIFEDEAGLMNRSLSEVGGEALVVSQFTLIASVRKGNRPSFNDAAAPAKGEADCLAVIAAIEGHLGRPCQSGAFGADMKVALLNDGPVTIVFDSQHKE